MTFFSKNHLIFLADYVVHVFYLKMGMGMAHSRIEDALLVQPVSKIILISQNHPGIILVFIFQEYIFPQHKNRFS